MIEHFWPSYLPVAYGDMRQLSYTSATFSSAKNIGPLSILRERQATPAPSRCQNG